VEWIFNVVGQSNPRKAESRSQFLQHKTVKRRAALGVPVIETKEENAKPGGESSRRIVRSMAEAKGGDDLV